jgi:hypothetical protein
MTSFTDEVMPTCNGSPCVASFLKNTKVLPDPTVASMCMAYAPPDFNPAAGVYLSSTLNAISYTTEPSGLALYS